MGLTRKEASKEGKAGQAATVGMAFTESSDWIQLTFLPWNTYSQKDLGCYKVSD